MSGYSEESQRLAQELADMLTEDLERSGRRVTRDKFGRHVVSPPVGGSEVVIRDGKTFVVVPKDGPLRPKRTKRWNLGHR